MTGTTLCPRCGAPIPWDGASKTVNCPYCQIVVTPAAHPPPGNVKAFHFVAVDALGNLATLHTLAGDTDLLLLDPSGKLRRRVKNVPEHGLAMDGAGNVYLGDEFGGTIEVRDPQGNVKSKFGSKKDKHTARVEALAVDGKGHIFAETNEGLNVFDQGGGYIETIDTSGVGGGLRSFAISSKNHLFILGNDKVAELDIGTLP